MADWKAAPLVGHNARLALSSESLQGHGVVTMNDMVAVIWHDYCVVRVALFYPVRDVL